MALSSKELAEKIIRDQLERLQERSTSQSFDLKDAELLASLVDSMTKLRKPSSSSSSTRNKKGMRAGHSLGTDELERYAIPEDDDEA